MSPLSMLQARARHQRGVATLMVTLVILFILTVIILA